ncbi:MAG: hypothetical protein QM498_15995 [Desulfobacterium sp.]
MIIVQDFCGTAERRNDYRQTEQLFISISLSMLRSPKYANMGH